MISEIRCHLVEVLAEFCQINVKWAAEEDPLRAVRSLVELRRVMAALAAAGYDFAENIRVIDNGLARLLYTGREQLLRAYVRSRDPEEIEELSETLVACISSGQWPDWQEEYDRAVMNDADRVA